MGSHSTRYPWGTTFYVAVMIAFAFYFTFASVQGDFGLFQRVQVEAEAELLSNDLAVLKADVARMENLTRRLSDGYLDLDLLDSQARQVLGLARSDEVVLR